MGTHHRSRTLIGGIAMAAFALSACAPAGYSADDYNNGAALEPAAAEVSAEPAAEDDPAAGQSDQDGEETAAGDDAEKKDDEADAPKLSADQVTTQLKAVTVKKMGETVQNEDGWVLYRFDDDKAKPEPESTCNGDCAKVWPPVMIDGKLPKLAGIDDSDIGTVKRDDGTTQLTVGNWPVYRYIGDKKPGKWSGQNVGGKWFVVKPDGTKNLTCLPAVSKPVPPPADDAEKSDSGSDSGDGEYTY